MNQPELFDLVHSHLGGIPDRRGEVSVDCPFCGKPAMKGKRFNYSVRGCYCFVCGAGGSLEYLAKELGLPDGVPQASRRKLTPPPAPEPEAPPAWLERAETILQQQLSHPDRYALWQAYKPISCAAIDRWQLGVGPLPGFHGTWLTFPIFEDGKITGMRGRAPGGKGWMNAYGTRAGFFNLEGITPGCVLYITENMIDAVWVMDIHPEYVAIAPVTGAATRMRPEWTEQIAAMQPAVVVVAYDNDLAGQAAGALRRELIEAWRKKNPQAKHPPQANGPKVANALLAAGIRHVGLFDWQQAPAGADVGWLLKQELQFA